MSRPSNRRRRRSRVQYPAQPYPHQAFVAPAPIVPDHAPAANVSVQVLQDKNASVAKVTLRRDNSWDYGDGRAYDYTVTGSAKREQGDRYDPVTGEKLALARTFQELADKLRRDANQAVNQIVREDAEMHRRAAERKARKGKPQQHKPLEQYQKELAARQGVRVPFREGGASAPIKHTVHTTSTSAVEELSTVNTKLDLLLHTLGKLRK